MMKKSLWAALLCTTLGGVSYAADHQDGPQATADPSGDITDVYTWMADANTVALVMDVTPDAATTSKFSDSVQYVFHTSSAAAYASPGTATDIICEFDAAQKISCWIGATEYVNGDASNTAGLKSSSGKVKVFAGLRNDPFFFNLDGFKATVADVEAAAPSLTGPPSAFNSLGCPALGADTATALATQLAHAPYDLSNPPSPLPAAVDHFAKFNVLSIILAVDKSLLTKGGPTVAVYGATYTK